jgi:hypothetical protein
MYHAGSRTLYIHACFTLLLQAGGCINTVLDVEVLSKVLQHVDLRDRLLSCSLACCLWRKAAAMSIMSVDVPRSSPTKATSLSAWLSAHAAEVKLDSISVTAGWDSDDSDEEDESKLILPMQQLTALRTMKLKNVDAKTADAEAHAAYAILMPALPGLTRLDLLGCRVRDTVQVTVKGNEQTCKCLTEPSNLQRTAHCQPGAATCWQLPDNSPAQTAQCNSA